MNYDKRIKLCKDCFQYFNYYLEEKKDLLVNYSSYNINFKINTFFEEERMEIIFYLYDLFDEDKIFMIEDIKRNIGFTTFCCYLAYYQSFRMRSQSIIVTDIKMNRYLVNNILGFVSIFKDFIKIEAKYVDIRKTLEFDNGSKIIFRSDVTYDFREEERVADLLIIDNAAMKNFDKFTSTIEYLIENKVAKKAIINFNNIPPLFLGSENFDFFKKEFKDKVNFLKIETK
jgi:hypothetical protein